MTHKLFRAASLFCLPVVAAATLFHAAATSPAAQRKSARPAKAARAAGKAARPKKTVQSKGTETLACVPADAPPTALTVTEVDAAAFAKLLPRTSQNARPLLVNFWATWCEPCRVEFPDLVKIDNEFRARGLEFFTVSLDDPGERLTSVPTFLSEMKAERIPAYLLNTPEPADAINAVDKTWTGALPATFLFNAQGQLVFKHTGRIDPAELSAAIKKALK